jgi:hypothetical protein
MSKSFKDLMGRKFDNWTVIAESEKPSYVKCECKCGKIKDVSVSSLISKKSTSCGCSKRGKKNEYASKKYLEEAKKYIGQYINGLKILDVRKVFKDNGNYIELQCECSCGNKFWARKNGILKNSILSCGHDRQKNLKDGQEKRKELLVDGTFIKAIDGTRIQNKNNSTGITGVSNTRNGKYRAYITFKGESYHLGTFETIDDAAQARKIAEKKIYGDFLKWYESAYKKQ